MSSAGVFFTTRAIPMSHSDLMRQKRIITASAVNPAKFPPRSQSDQTENNKLRQIACSSKNQTANAGLGSGFVTSCTPTNQNL